MELLYAVTAILLLTHPQASAEAAALACSAMKNVVIKSLFPMMVLSRLLAHSPLMNKLCTAVSKTRLWKRLELSDALLPAVFSGLLSGLPVTAAEAQELVKNGSISADEGAKAVALSSIPSPAFVIMAASPSVRAGVFRYTTLIILSYLIASSFPSVRSMGNKRATTLTFSEAMTSSAAAAISVSANIVFFSVLTCVLSVVFPKTRILLATFFEMGSAVIFADGNGVLSAAVLGWCGLSALSQIRTSAPSVSASPYIITRCISCVVMVIMQIFAEFLQNTL